MNGRIIAAAVAAYVAAVLWILAFIKGATRGDPK